MKKLHILLFSLFLLTSPSVFADDISDFQIEGMSVGDSLLDHLSMNEIKNAYNYDHLPSSMKFRIAEFYSDTIKSDTYDAFQFFYKPEDENFIIHSVGGFIDCDDKKDCTNKFNQIENDLSNIFKNIKKIGPEITPHIDDKSGDSISTKIYYVFKSGGKIDLTFMNWSDKMRYADSVSISIETKEVRDWINNDYF